MRVVVVGAGAAGLMAALLLDEAGHDVVMVERDTWLPSDDAVDAVASWDRGGIPQGSHPHNFMAAARNVLAARTPAVLDDLLGAGAEEVPIGRNLPADVAVPADRRAELTALATRRELLDWALMRAVRRTATVELLLGTAATGLLIDRGDPPAVRGVVTDAGDHHADLVIDAGGRRSPLLSVLARHGIAAVVEGDESCGILYLSQYHRLRPGAEPGPLMFGFAIRGELDDHRAGLFKADNGMVATILGIHPDDAERRRSASASDAAYRAALRSFPGLGTWFEDERMEPVTRVAPMGGLRNTLRRLVGRDGPRVSGYVLAGDSASTTNPMLGWGASLAMLQVVGIVDELAAGRTGVDLVTAVDRRLQDAVAPRWRASAAEDADRLMRWRGVEPRSHHDVAAVAHMRALTPLVPADAVIAERVMRRANLLDHPNAIFADPEVARRVAAMTGAS